MQTRLIHFALSAALLASMAAGQTIVAPNGYASTPGTTNNSYPWSRAASSMRIQFVYDSTNFTLQGITGAVAITRLRYRTHPTATTWTGGSWPQVQIDMGDAATDFAAPSSVFANNLGGNVGNVHSGPVTVVGGTGPGVWYIDIPLTTPCIYDPTTNNDLVVDIRLDGTGWSGGSIAADHVSGTAGAGGPALGSRIYDTTGLTGTSGTVGTNYSCVCEFTCTSASGLFPSFSATPTRGASPLTVQFTDRSYSSDPGGVLAWQWDLDGDGIIDSVLQNPTFTYTGCASYNVSLTAIDAAHGPITVTRNNLIVTDEVNADFSYLLAGPAGVVQFQDNSDPPATSWAWDLNGDSIVDSTLPNPIWVYGATCGTTPTTVTMTVTRNCRGPYTVTKQVYPASGIETLRNGNTSTTAGYGSFFDVTVTNPVGISVCMMEMKTTAAASAPLTFDVYLTPGTWVGNNANMAVWRKVATTTTVGAPTSAALEFMTFTPPLYLPPGSYGMHVVCPTVSPQYTSQSTTTFSNQDITLTVGATGLLGGTGLLNPRLWNGAFYYTTAATGGEAGYGYFAPGCVGTSGVISNVASTLPQLGQTMTVGIGNLPAPEAAFFLIGLSRTQSNFGPLPLDLGIVGAPGCLVRVSDTAKILTLGAAGAATLTIPIPNSGSLHGMQIYTQPLGLDVGGNALGVTAGDAAAGVLGL